MGFKVYGRSDFPTTKTTDREFSTKEDAINYGHSISGSYNNVRVLDSGMSSVVLAQWEDGKMTKNESAERAARDKKSQDNKDRLQNEDKQRRSEANERRAINEQNRKEKWGNADKAVVGRNKQTADLTTKKVVFWLFVIFIVVPFVLLLIGEAILYLSSAISWVSYPFHFLFGNADFFDLKSLTDSQFDGSQPKVGDMLVLTGQFWLDFLILLVVSAIAVFIFYKIINFKNKTTRTRNISLAVMVYIVGGFITTNTNYIGNGLINKDAQYIAKSFPSIVYLREEFEKSKRENAKLQTKGAKRSKRAKIEAVAANKKAKEVAEQRALLSEQRALNSIKAEKTLSLAPNYDAHAKKLNAAINSQSEQRDINLKFREVVTSEIERLGNNADLNHLDTTNVTNMRALFSESSFNGDISKWDVSNVTNMIGMFSESQFNGNISNWDVSNVMDVSGMFRESQFNGDISKWDVSKVTNMIGMFYRSKFNGDISKWVVNNETINTIVRQEVKRLGNNANLNHIDTSSVTKMEYLFYKSQFKGDISKWDVSKVTDMRYMFNSSKFNGDISKWVVNNETIKTIVRQEVKRLGNDSDLNHLDVSMVTSMQGVLGYSQFNGDISKWDVSKVENMWDMFRQSKFNGDISKWDVSNVTNMIGMFYRSKFNGDISGWAVKPEGYKRK